jgi:hypothetical protein
LIPNTKIIITITYVNKILVKILDIKCEMIDNMAKPSLGLNIVTPSNQRPICPSKTFDFVLASDGDLEEF